MATPTDERRWIEAWLPHLAGQPDDALVAPGVTKGEVLDLLQRPETPDGAVYDPGVVYGTGGGRKLRMHLYSRADPTERRPGFVFVHGGAWTVGHPLKHARQCAELARQGYVAASIEYRHYPETRWPGFVEDAKCAVRWLRAHHTELGLDSARIGIGGGSAGGHIAAMAALTPGRFEGSGGCPDQPSAPQAAVLWYPATDLADAPPLLRTEALKVFDASELAEASPIRWVHPGAPPILTMSGQADPLTPPPMIEEFHRVLRQHGIREELVFIPGASHAFDMLSRDAWKESFRHTLAFLNSTLGEP